MVLQTPYHREEQLRMLATMTNRTPLIAANWKMNDPPQHAFADDSPYRTQSHVDVVVFPTFLDLERCACAGLFTGAQCGRAEPSGAFTGDISMTMLKAVGCSYVLCGHSDRRTFHKETNEDIALQAHAALDAQLIPVVCIGETADEREKGIVREVVQSQVKTILLRLGSRVSQVVFAYEPVWAISRGNATLSAATPEDAQSMHAFIRSLLPKTMQEGMRILYGASMKPDNAHALLTEPDIDGGLIGSASLDPEKFRAIVACARQSA